MAKRNSIPQVSSYRNKERSVFVSRISENGQANSGIKPLAQMHEWQEMFNAIGHPTLILEPDHSIVACNKAVGELTGKPAEYFIGRKCFEVFHKQKNAPEHCPMKKLLKSGRFETYEMEVEALGKIFLVSCTPVLDETGALDKIIHIATDITEQRRAESEINRYKEELSQLRRNSYLDLLGVMIGHHLSQPLTVMNMLMDSTLKKLKKGRLEDKEVARILKTCLNESKSAVETIQKVREHTQQWMKGRIGTFKPEEIIKNVVTTLESKARHANLRIEAADLKNLPRVKGYRNAFEQTVLNLAENAIEAADGKKRHRLVIKAKKKDDSLELSFSDDCCGIAKKNLEKIFEPFYSTKARKGSKCLGLGLPIISRILDSMGGEIRATSTLGKGTTFYVSWPLS